MTPEDEIQRLRAENQVLKEQLARIQAFLAQVEPADDSPDTTIAEQSASAVSRLVPTTISRRHGTRGRRGRPRNARSVRIPTLRSRREQPVLPASLMEEMPTAVASQRVQRAILMVWRSPWIIALALGGILLLGAYFRGISLLSWDDNFRLHPDERFYGDVAAAVKIPGSWDDYFDSATSPLNPRNAGRTFFVYGLFPLTLTRLIAEPIGLTDYYTIYKIGRVLSTLVDLGSLVFVFLLGSRLYSRRVGLTAALLAALTVLSIQQAHFFTVDTFASFFTLLSLYWIVRVAQGGNWGSYVGMGISVGLAMAGGRLTLATLGLVGVVAALQWAVAPQSAQRSVEYNSQVRQTLTIRSDGLYRFGKIALPRLVIAGALALLVFRVLQPDAFIGSRPDSPTLPGAHPSFLQGLGFFDIRLDPRYISNLQEIQRLIDGATDVPPSLQWVGRTRYLFPLQNMVLWGMGLPLGALVCVAWGAVAWQMLRWRRLAALALWIWTSGYFAWQGGQFVIPMRYLLPIYAPLIIFGAWILVTLWERLAPASEYLDEGRTGRFHRWWLSGRIALRRYGRWSLVAVVLGTFCWAYAFTRIYARPHSRITASHWLFEHVPVGSAITSEQWDDALPLPVTGRNPWKIYRGIQTTPFAEDDPAKYIGSVDASRNNQIRPGLVDQLAEADYVVLSSNRVYDSIVRMPMRYPALIRYYHYLFNGELGFELVADIGSYPTLFGISIPDQRAEESFSVYDHPRVLIFHKTASFSHVQAQHLLTDNVNWAEVYKVPSIQGDKAPTVLRFTPQQWAVYKLGGTWTTLFTPAWLAQQAPVLTWLLVIELLGMAAFLLGFPLLGMLPDRGFSLAKAAAILLVSYGAWLSGSFRLMAFGPLSVWLWVGLLGCGAGAMTWRHRPALHVFWRERRTALLTAEGLFLAAFVVLLVVRLLNPDLWHPDRGGEKPMDLAYLTATLKSQAFPPYDPWFAGGYINYYYFGFVIVGVLIHLTGIVPAIAYNLAVPTLFALTALGTWGVVYNLLAPRRPTIVAPRLSRTAEITQPRFHNRARSERRAITTGLLAVLLVLLVGNLAQAIWFLPGSAKFSSAATLGPLTSYAQQQSALGRAEWAYWDATRIVDGTVNEFPFFTFLFADLHAHMIVMPFSLATLALTVALVRARPADPVRRPLLGLGWPGLYVLGLLALFSGSLRAINTWDYITFTTLVVATFMFQAWQGVRWSGMDSGCDEAGLFGRRAGVMMRLVGSAAIEAVGVVIIGALLFLPFTSHFVTESSGAALWTGPRTSLWDWLRINGLWVFVLLSAAALLIQRGATLSSRTLIIRGAALAVLVAIGLRVNTSALSVLLPLSLYAGVITWTARDVSARRFLPVLWAGAGLALNIIVEFIAINGDVGRLNTVFKFGLHSWILYALTASMALSGLWNAARRWLPWRGYLWRAAVLLLISAALAYPVTATFARLADRATHDLPDTLDGMAYMNRAKANELGQEIALKPDAEAIRWIQQHISGSPVMLEAHLPSYRWGGRIAAYTGLPTLLGWEWHELQQRSAVNVNPIVEARSAAIAQIYSSPDVVLTHNLLRAYGVDYIYVGGLERVVYSPVNVTKFDQFVNQGVLDRVYDQEGVQIYHVKDPRSEGILTTDLTIAKPQAGAILDNTQQVQPATLQSAPAPSPQALHGSTPSPDQATEQPPTPSVPSSVHAQQVQPTPVDTATALALAQNYRQINRIEDAVRVLSAATKRWPGDAALWRLLGDILSDAKRYDKAEAAYIEAIVITPSADNFAALGAAQVAWGQLEDAEGTLKQATVVDGTAPEPYYWLGILFAQKGQHAEARANLEHYLQLAPTGRWSADASTRLKTLP